MSLRDAKFDDHWRHIYRRRYSTRFANISFENLLCFSNATLNFSAGLSAIVGGNGVGKSTIAAAIAELLEGELPTDSEGGEERRQKTRASHLERLKGSSTQAVVYAEGRELRLSVEENDRGLRRATGDLYSGDFRLLDPSDLATAYTNQIYEDQNFDDLLESVTPLELDAAGLSIAAYIVGKNYLWVRIYEISDYAGFERFPYFQVSAAGVEYGSEAMGRGELSMLLCYWTVRDMQNNSILVLEEPETHVSPRSQDCLMNVMAKFSDENGIWMIITTHSPTVIRRIPQEHLKLIVRENGPSSIPSETTNVQIAKLLGGGVAFRGVMLVEDGGAKAFLLNLLDELAPDLMPQFEVLVADSESGITKHTQDHASDSQLVEDGRRI